MLLPGQTEEQPDTVGLVNRLSNLDVDSVLLGIESSAEFLI